MNACDHPWWIEGEYTDATCKACGVPGWNCPSCSPDDDDAADEGCTTCGGSGYVVVHELISRLTRELEEARRERSAARAEAMTAQASLRRANRELEAARERERALRDDLTAAIGHLSALVDLLHHDGHIERCGDHAASLVSAAERYLESPSREQEVGAATPQGASGTAPSK